MAEVAWKALYTAIRANDLTQARNCSKQIPQENNIKRLTWGLHLALVHGDETMIEWFVSAFGNLLDGVDLNLCETFATLCDAGKLANAKKIVIQRWQTLSHTEVHNGFYFACQKGYLDIVRWLVDSGYIIAMESTYNSGGGWPALNAAAKLDDQTTFNWLVKRFAPGKIQLDCAASAKHLSRWQ